MSRYGKITEVLKRVKSGEVDHDFIPFKHGVKKVNEGSLRTLAAKERLVVTKLSKEERYLITKKK